MIEKGQLEGVQWVVLQVMCVVFDGDFVYVVGVVLLFVICFYMVGVQDFCVNVLIVVCQCFEVVLVLLLQQVSECVVWVVFMLGCLYVIEEWCVEVIVSFIKVCVLVLGGVFDLLGLVVVSYGEQVCLMLVGENGFCNWFDFNEGWDCGMIILLVDFKQVICLYVEQVVCGLINVQDLLMVLVFWSLGYVDISVVLIDDLVVQCLLVVYVLVCVGDMVEGSGNGDSYYDLFVFNSGLFGYFDVVCSVKFKFNIILVILVDVFKWCGLEKIEGVDCVVVLVYCIGCYDFVVMLVNWQEIVLFWWVCVKLVLCCGDIVVVV